jgi:hypothetical protein
MDDGGTQRGRDGGINGVAACRQNVATHPPALALALRLPLRPRDC